MSADKFPPPFGAFANWLASGTAEPRRRGARARDRYATLLQGARAARHDVLHEVPGHVEVLQLLAAADGSGASRPPELTTARGFRVTLAYDEGGTATPPSICVLVRCPAELIDVVEGKTAFLWAGADRFPLGEFDSEGKAIGTLPAGIDVSPSDFAAGRVKLEEPSGPADR